MYPSYFSKYLSTFDLSGFHSFRSLVPCIGNNFVWAWSTPKPSKIIPVLPTSSSLESISFATFFYPSYAFDLSDDVLRELVLASKKVAKLIDSKLEDVGRTGMIFEGFGVDHAHTKLFPMHGTSDLKEWKPLKSNVDKYFEKYEGYISSHD